MTRSIKRLSLAKSLSAIVMLVATLLLTVVWIISVVELRSVRAEHDKRLAIQGELNDLLSRNRVDAENQETLHRFVRLDQDFPYYTCEQIVLHLLGDENFLLSVPKESHRVYVRTASIPGKTLIAPQQPLAWKTTVIELNGAGSYRIKLVDKGSAPKQTGWSIQSLRGPNMLKREGFGLGRLYISSSLVNSWPRPVCVGTPYDCEPFQQPGEDIPTGARLWYRFQVSGTDEMSKQTKPTPNTIFSELWIDSPASR